jgi:hypothetical protein
MITLVVSILETIIFWSLGLARKIWPAHPMLFITIIAAVSGILIQALLSTDTRSHDSKRPH